MKGTLELDWGEVLTEKCYEEDPPTLIIAKSDRSLPDVPSEKITGISYPSQKIESMTYSEIENAINSLKKKLSVLPSNFNDKRALLLHDLKQFEGELCRRTECRSCSQRVDGCTEPSERTVSTCLAAKGLPNDVRQGYKQSIDHAESTFSAIFTQKMKDNECLEENAFGGEISIIGSCNRQSKRQNECHPRHLRRKSASSSGKLSQVSASRSPIGRKKKASSNHDRCPDYGSCCDGGLLEKKIHSQNGSMSKKCPTVVIVDEDEMAEGIDSSEVLPNSFQDKKIYYPSRDDAESVEICFSDTSCLAPEELLSSPIMNFYIRYLQLHGSPLDNALCNYHFFNTFFYEKLKQALSHKGDDKISLFAKFRRWWKGVDIFRKAYVLIPIHDECHWSLVIVCIPDKEDESGPIILHLDSLGFHCSVSVFDNIKRYLISEWEFINQDVVPLDVPIADRVWKHLPHRIEEKTISVPQQKNVYDCGLFVLFFIKRFLQKAPARLKKKDLSMFGTRWFKPEQASSLRVEIRSLVLNEFENSKPEGLHLESTSSNEEPYSV